MFCQIHTVCLPTRSAVMCADFEIFLECFFSVLNAANCARNVYRVICIFSIRLKLFISARGLPLVENYTWRDDA